MTCSPTEYQVWHAPEVAWIETAAAAPPPPKVQEPQSWILVAVHAAMFQIVVIAAEMQNHAHCSMVVAQQRGTLLPYDVCVVYALHVAAVLLSQTITVLRLPLFLATAAAAYAAFSAAAAVGAAGDTPELLLDVDAAGLQSTLQCCACCYA
jgi:hypothetical protein